MNQIARFEFEQHQTRIVTINEEPWFVAKDVAEALGYSWSGTQRIAHVPEEWRGVTSVVTPSGEQEMAVLSEQGLYFFLGRSDKPMALPYQKKVAGEIMPAIRKTGGYVGPRAQQLTLDIFNRFMETAGQVMASLGGETREIREKTLAIEARVEALAERVEPEQLAAAIDAKIDDRLTVMEIRERQATHFNNQATRAACRYVDKLMGLPPTDPLKLAKWKKQRQVEFHEINHAAKEAAFGTPRTRLRNPEHARLALLAIYERCRGIGILTPTIPEVARP